MVHTGIIRVVEFALAVGCVEIYFRQTLAVAGGVGRTNNLRYKEARTLVATLTVRVVTVVVVNCKSRVARAILVVVCCCSSGCVVAQEVAAVRER